MPDKEIIVVGAGLAGLTAAYFLKRRGTSVTVLEASNRVGGRIQTEDREGFIIDTGAQFLFTGYPILHGLLHELKLDPHVTRVRPYIAIVREGRPHRVSVTRPLSLLSSRLLSWRGWLKFIGSWLRLGWKTRNLPLNDYAAWHDFDGQDATTWCRAQGSEVFTYLIEPILATLYLQSPQYMPCPLPFVLANFATRRHHMQTLRGGFAALPKALAMDLDIRLNASVLHLEINRNGVEAHTAKRIFRADHVILATTASEACRLYGQANALERRLMQTTYSKALTIAIATESGFRLKPWATGIYALLVPKVERGVVAAVAIESNKSTDRVPSGELLNVILTDEEATALFPYPEEHILKCVLPEVEAYFPNVSNSIHFTHVCRWREAEPRFPVGRSIDIRTYRHRAHSCRKVLLVGDYMGMPFTEGAAETGWWAADQIVRS